MTTDRDDTRCTSPIAPGGGRCYFDAVDPPRVPVCAGHFDDPAASVNLEALADYERDRRAIESYEKKPRSLDDVE